MAQTAQANLARSQVSDDSCRDRGPVVFPGVDTFADILKALIEDFKEARRVVIVDATSDPHEESNSSAIDLSGISKKLDNKVQVDVFYGLDTPGTVQGSQPIDLFIVCHHGTRPEFREMAKPLLSPEGTYIEFFDNPDRFDGSTVVTKLSFDALVHLGDVITPEPDTES